MEEWEPRKRNPLPLVVIALILAGFAANHFISKDSFEKELYEKQDLDRIDSHKFELEILRYSIKKLNAIFDSYTLTNVTVGNSTITRKEPGIYKSKYCEAMKVFMVKYSTEKSNYIWSIEEGRQAYEKFGRGIISDEKMNLDAEERDFKKAYATCNPSPRTS